LSHSGSSEADGAAATSPAVSRAETQSNASSDAEESRSETGEMQSTSLDSVEFYFSENNLELDFFLRQQMDAKGFVPLDTVLNFRRVQDIIQTVAPPGPGQAPLDRERRLSLLRDAVLSSHILELSQDRTRLRRKQNWERYVLPAQTKR
ncbi:hypothetical protein MBRA1_001039, partial [Malassezia brasiliensis]